MKKIILTSLLCSAFYGTAQVRMTGTTINSVNSSAFIDASSNTTNNSSVGVGKGLVFPRVDLSTFTFVGTTGIGSNFPSRFDGMVVYNTATAGVAGAGATSGALAPGFWFYENKSTTTTGGTWKPLGSGNFILSGTTAPLATTGLDGDFYINATTSTLFGPKSSGAWPAGVSLVGAAGLTGPAGAVGPQGPAGANGVDGAVGPQGPQGPAGAQGPIGLTGPAGAVGATGAQGPIGLTGPTGPAGADGVGGVTTAGTNISITGSGTVASPYVVNASGATDATTTTTGIVRLAGDLAGTAASPLVAANAITSAKIADNAVTVAKLPAGATASTFLRGDGTWAAASTPLSGVAPIDISTGVVSLNNSGVSTDKLANNAVTTVKIADNAVTIAKLPTGATASTFLRGDGTWADAATDKDITATEVALATKIDGAQLYAIKGSFTANGTSAEVTVAKPAGMTGYYSMTVYKDGKTFRRDILSFDTAATTNNVVTGTGFTSEAYPAGSYNYVLEYFK